MTVFFWELPVRLGYFGRYHLTQLLLPQPLRTAHPRILMLTEALKTVPPLDPRRFPRFANFYFRKDLLAMNGASLYYADQLMKTPSHDVRRLHDAGPGADGHIS